MIQSIYELAKTLKSERNHGHSIALCHGTFDGLHIGHIKYFQAASRLGDILVVTLTPDVFVNKGPGRPVFNEQLRAEAIDAIRCVDYVAITEEATGINTIKILKPDFYIKGQDYEDLDSDPTGNIYKEKEAVESIGGELKFTHELMFHATNLLYRSKLSKKAQAFLKAFREEHTVDEVLGYLDKLSDLKMLVVGETITDVYQYGTTLGKAGKFPIVAFQNEHSESYDGGIIVVSNHLKDFVNVSYYTDEVSTVKKRYVQNGQKLFETYSTCENPFYKGEPVNFNDYDVVLVNDFGHGFLDVNKRNDIIARSRFLAVNVQFNAGNMGMSTLNKYEGWDYACIDHVEIRMATGEQFADIEYLLHRYYPDNNMIVTLAKEGCLVYKNEKCHRVPPFAVNIVDTVGAGDAFLAITAPLMYIDTPADIIGFIGNCVGAIACGWPGNKEYITKEKLVKFIKQLME